MKLDEKQNALRSANRRAFVLSLYKSKKCFSTPFRLHSFATASEGRGRTATATTTSELVNIEMHEIEMAVNQKTNALRRVSPKGVLC